VDLIRLWISGAAEFGAIDMQRDTQSIAPGATANVVVTAASAGSDAASRWTVDQEPVRIVGGILPYAGIGAVVWGGPMRS
jgi:hypothetical protein